MKLLLLLLLITASVSHAKRHVFHEYDCAVTIPDLRWTVDTSGSEPGLVMHAYMEDHVREILLFAGTPPAGARSIFDPGVVDSLLAGIRAEGELIGKGVYHHGGMLGYDVCFGHRERQHQAGTRYLFVIGNGYLYTLVARGRYTDPCTDRGFQTIARSLVIADEPGMIDEELMAEKEGFYPYGSEELSEEARAHAREEVGRYGVLGLAMLIAIVGLPAWIAYYWLMRRKRLMRAEEFEAQLATAPELELARVILNREEYSIDAVDIAERRLARHGRREEMLEAARLQQRTRLDTDDAGILLSNDAIRNRILWGVAMGVISSVVILVTLILRLRSGAAGSDSDIMIAIAIAIAIAWALICGLSSHGLHRRRLGAAIVLIPSLVFLPLWTAYATGALSLVPLVLLAIPSLRTIRAVEDALKKREQGIDLGSVGWEEGKGEE